MSVTPILFDRKLVRARLERARQSRPDFLEKALQAEIAERAALILRQFERTLLCGALAPRLPSQFGHIIASGRDIVLDLEALPLAPESVDCIVCLLDLQSLNDLPGALIQMRRALKPDGLVLACLFGADTLAELRQAWLEAEAEIEGGASPRVAPMIGLGDLGHLLQRAGFALPVTDLDRTVVRYASALALMREVKALGFSNSLAQRSRKPVTRRLLAAAAAAYERSFSDQDGRVRASIEIAWATAWAPHESQPKPLKPGSAKARLAQALGVTEIGLKR